MGEGQVQGVAAATARGGDFLGVGGQERKPITHAYAPRLGTRSAEGFLRRTLANIAVTN